jgi:uncharacterized membrane protein (DUF485 family)
MQTDVVRKVRNNPKYHELVSKRSKFGWTLAVVMLVIYYGFILTIAFFPSFLATPVAPGKVMSIGIPIGVGVILSAFVLTGIFVVRANSEFDRLNKDIVESAK